MSESLYQEIYAVVRQIPEGQVATYGQVALLIGRPRNARQVGYALSSLNSVLGQDHDVPWHRVVNAAGKISQRAHSDYQNYQQILLEEEGVEIGLQGRIDLKHYLWRPDDG